MLRLSKIVDHFNQFSFPTFTSKDVTGTVELTFKISDEYMCRFVNKSDHPAVNEICESIYRGHDYLHRSFDRLLEDDKSIFLGVEYLPESKIIATNVFKIMDGGITAFAFGGRTHPKHRGKKLFVPFSNWGNALIKKLYPSIQRIRSTTAGSNKISIHVSGGKTMKCLSFADIKYPSTKNAFNYFNKDFIRTPQKMEQLLSTTVNTFNIEKDEGTIIKDIDFIINLLKNKFNNKMFCVDWKIFDLSIGQKSIQDAKLYLKKEINSNRLKVVTNKKCSVLGMIYNDERPKCTELYIYGLKKDGVSALLMLNNLFNQWKNKMDNAISNDNETCFLFVDIDIVENYPQMDVLWKEFGSVVLLELI